MEPIPRKVFKHAGLPTANPEEYLRWLELRGKCVKEPYDDEIMEFLKTVTPQSYFDLWYRDPLFRERMWHPLKFLKADQPILSTTPNVWDALYGDFAWTQISREMSLLAALPKVPWRTDGARMLTKELDDQIQFIGEEEYFPETRKFEYDAYRCESKWALTHWEVSEKAIQHSARNEGVDLVADLMQEMSISHREGIDKDMLADASAEAAAATKDRYVDDVLAVESIDRIISNKDEEDVFGGDHDHWFDPFETDIDRDAGTAYDSVVLHNSGDDRPITDALMKQLIRECEDRGARPETSFILTGRDTRDDLAELWQAQMRHTPELTSEQRRGLMRVQFSVNGVRTARGYEAGFKVASYDDYPIIVDKNVPKDTKSRVYLIDTRFLRAKTLVPTQYLSTGPDDWIKLQRFWRKFLYITVLELECLNFRALGKIRDLG